MNHISCRLKKMAGTFKGYGLIPLAAILFTSIFISLQARQLLFKVTTQSYTDLIVGIITRENANKGPDYLAPLLFWVLFAIMIAVHHMVISGISEKDEIVNEINKIYVFPLTFILFAFGAQIITRQSDNSFFQIAYNSTFISVVVTTVLFKFRKNVTKSIIRQINLKIWTSVIAGFFSALSISTFLARSSHRFRELSEVYSFKISCFVFAAVLLFLIQQIISKRDPQSLNRSLTIFCGYIQIPLPLLLLALIPKPWLSHNMLIEGYQTTAALHIILWLIIVFAIYSTAARACRLSAGEKNLSILAPWAIMAVMVFIAIPVNEVFTLSTDDFHYGEANLPWHQLFHFGKLPWIDFSPTTGLNNVYQGLFKWLFFDDKFMAFSQATTLLQSVYMGLLFFAAMKVINMPAAILLSLTFGAAYELIPAFMLLLISETLLKRKLLWLTVWITAVPFLVTFHISSGIAIGIASFPVFLVVLYNQYREDRGVALKFMGATAVISLLLLFLTPLGKMLEGLLFFVRQHAEINTTAGAKMWKYSDKNVFRDGIFGADILFEAFRFGWIIILPLLLLIALIAYSQKESSKRIKIIIFSTVMAGYLYINMKYALGRIDTGITRTGGSTLMALMFGIPVLIFLRFDKPRHRFWIIPTLALLAAASLVIRKVDLPDPVYLLINSHSPTLLKDSDLVVNGEEYGIPAIGTAVVNERHFEELVELRKLLSKYLKPGERYVDLTNRTSRYVYMNQPVSVFDNAPYTTPTEAMQDRIISSINKSPPEMIMIGYSRIDHDGTPMSLRNPLIYRYLLLNYIPVAEGSFLFMIHNSRIGGNYVNQRDLHKELLDSVFLPEHLVGIPAAWGGGWGELARLFTPIASIDSAMVPLPETQRNTGSSRVTYLLGNAGISGSNAGYMLLDYVCMNGDPDQNLLYVSWKEKFRPFDQRNVLQLFARNGKLLIPLESSPRWLLAGEIESIVMESGSNDKCSGFKVGDAGLFRRNSRWNDRLN